MKKMIVLQICVLMIFLFSLSFAQDTAKAPASTEVSPDARAKAMQAYGKMPLTFVENQGQMDSTVQFYLQGPAGTMFFTKTEVVMEFVKRNNPPENKGKPSVLPGMDRSTTPVMEERLVLRRQFLNTDSACQLIGTQALPGKINILRGNDPAKWKQNLSTFSEIKYQNLYPGIDVLYSGTNSQLETSMHLAPHANIKSVEVTFQGADKIKLTRNGDLQIDTKMGTFVEKKPGAYQEIKGQKISIPAKFILKKKNIVGFEVGTYDPALPLVID